MSYMDCMSRVKILIMLCLALFKYLNILFWVSLILFIILRLMPLDPSGMLIPPTATPHDVAIIRHNLGLDQPIWVQYKIWIINLLSGDFGVSIQTGEPVIQSLKNAIPITSLLVFCAIIIGICLGLVLTLFAFYFQNTWISRSIEVFNNMTLSIPEFLWSILLIFIFGLILNWLPFFGLIDPSVQLHPLSDNLLINIVLNHDLSVLSNLMAHLFMPIMVLAMSILPMIVKTLYVQLQLVYQQDFIKFAQLRGHPKRYILLRHALPNAIYPTIALIAVQASMLVGGTLLVETIFGLPGLGALMLKGITNQDLPIIQSVALCYGIAVLFINIVIKFISLHFESH